MARRWDHIYSCHKQNLKCEYGFAELCLQCDKWIVEIDRWEEHCQQHIDDYENLPIQFNQVKYRHTPATAAFCMFCLFDQGLKASVRYKQWPNVHYWKLHNHHHFAELEAVMENERTTNKSLACRDPRCHGLFESLDEFKYHCQDYHSYLELSPHRPGKSCTSIKRSANLTNNENRIEFVHETVESLSVPQIMILPGEAAQNKRKRGRPKKSIVTSAASQPDNADDDSVRRRGRGNRSEETRRIRKLGRSHTRRRGNRYRTLSTDSSYSSTSSHDDELPNLDPGVYLESSDNETESDPSSDYELIQPGDYWVSSKRRKLDKQRPLLNMSKTKPQVVIYV